MSRNKTEYGFTLIEVLIAMTLLSIMVVLLFGTLRICAESWEKGESKIEKVNEVAVVYNFFQRHLSEAKPLYDDFSVVGQQKFSFQGDEQSLQFVGNFPASAGRGGLQLFSIQLENSEDDAQSAGTHINIILTPFFPTVEGQEHQKEQVTLIKHIKQFSLSYFGTDESGENSWQSQWLEKETLPQLVRINIEQENSLFWPDMIVELKIAGTQTGAEQTEQDADTEGEEQGEDDVGMTDDVEVAE